MRLGLIWVWVLVINSSWDIIRFVVFSFWALFRFGGSCFHLNICSINSTGIIAFMRRSTVSHNGHHIVCTLHSALLCSGKIQFCELSIIPILATGQFQSNCLHYIGNVLMFSHLCKNEFASTTIQTYHYKLKIIASFQFYLTIF